MDSQAIIFGYPESQGSILTANTYGSDGIFVANGSFSVFLGACTGISHDQRVNNGGSGIAIVLDGAVVSPCWGREVHDREQPESGLDVSEGGSALIIGGLTVQNNQTGLLADGAGTLTLVSVPSNPSTSKIMMAPTSTLIWHSRDLRWRLHRQHHLRCDSPEPGLHGVSVR